LILRLPCRCATPQRGGRSAGARSARRACEHRQSERQMMAAARKRLEAACW